MPTFIVERYWPGVTKEQLTQALIRSQQVIAQMNQAGVGVRHLRSALLPGEEVVFSLYEGPSAESVREANDRAGIHFDRIVEAIEITGQTAP